jgi:hypothetical protein
MAPPSKKKSPFDDPESVPQDLTELFFRPNMSLALLPTELIVPDCEVLLTGV